MKYIVFTDNTAVIFSNMIDHRSMAIKPVHSAGFCIIETYRNQFDDISVSTCTCYGRSETLNKSADPDHDRIVISEIFRGM